jgi:hypothetical protein
VLSALKGLRMMVLGKPWLPFSFLQTLKNFIFFLICLELTRILANGFKATSSFVQYFATIQACLLSLISKNKANRSTTIMNL